MAPEPEMVRVLSTSSHVRFAPQVPLCARRLSVKQKRNAISDKILVLFILLELCNSVLIVFSLQSYNFFLNCANISYPVGGIKLYDYLLGDRFLFDVQSPVRVPPVRGDKVHI